MREIKFRAWDWTKKNIRSGSKGWYLENGYIMQKAEYHPFANKRGYVAEHRLIMENSLGRYLKPDEVVHHFNRKRDDNRVENLDLMYSQKDHARLEDDGKRNTNGRFILSEPIFNEIKFRLFDKDRNITKIYTLNKLISTTFRRSKFEFRGRWTGLKDKNGREIYEGDVCNNGDWEEDVHAYNYRVEEVVYNEKEASFSGWNLNEDGMTCEVIGNIYEHPDLLKEARK